MTGLDVRLAAIEATLEAIRLEQVHQRPSADSDDGRLVAVMWAAFGCTATAMTSADVLGAAQLRSATGAALRAELSRARALSVRKVGKLLARLEGRLHDGLVIQEHGRVDAGVVLWKICEFGRPAGSSNSHSTFQVDHEPATLTAP